MFATSVKEYGDKILQKGIQKGIQKGEIQGKQKMLIKLLSKKFELTSDEINLIHSQENTVKLDAAIDEFVFAVSKDQVLKCLE